MAIDINKLSSLRLGYVGENKSRTISIDVSDWLDRWPDAVIDIAVRRPLEDGGYIPEETTVADGILTWVVTRADVAVAGTGSAQIRAIQESTGKCFVSRVVHTIIEPSITGDLANDVEPPETAWVERVLVAAEETKRAAAKVEAALEDTQGMLSASVSVKAFGAVGDGVVDDTDAFQAAADSGYNIYVPQERGERYRITRSINVTKYGQKWIGSRRGWDYGQDQAGIYAENLDVLFNATTTPGNYMGARFAFIGLNLKHMGLFPGTPENDYNDKVTRQGTAIRMDCTSGADNNDSLVCDCSVDFFETAVEMHGRGFTVRDCFIGGTEVAIKSYYTYDAPDREDESLYPGEKWQQYDTGYRGIAVRGNKFHTCTNSCITFYSDYVFNVSVENNIYDGGGSGYFVTFEGIVQDALINGNNILSCYAVKANGALADGITFTSNNVSAPKAGLFTKDGPALCFESGTVVKNLVVTGNMFKNCPAAILSIINLNNADDRHVGIICTSNMIVNPCNIKTSGTQGSFVISIYTDNIVISSNTMICNAIPAAVSMYLIRTYGGQLAPKNSFVQGNSASSGIRIASNMSTSNGCVIQADPV